MKRWVVVHPTDGIFVGHSMGLAFFSLIEDAWQNSVVCFEHHPEAFVFMDIYLDGGEKYKYVELEVADGRYATYAELCAAGLEREAAPLNPARVKEGTGTEH